MDSLSNQGLTPLFTSIAMLAHQKFKLETNSLHLDSSSFSLHGNYEIEAYNGTKDRAELFNDMPMNVVNGALGFFLNLSNELNRHTQKSTIAELAKVQAQRITLLNGDGTPA